MHAIMLVDIECDAYVCNLVPHNALLFSSSGKIADFQQKRKKKKKEKKALGVCLYVYPRAREKRQRVKRRGLSFENSSAPTFYDLFDMGGSADVEPHPPIYICWC